MLFVRKVSIGNLRAAPEKQLLFVHGTCATERQFQLLLECMDQQMAKERIVCVLYDFMGCGRSPALKSWDAYDNAEGVADLEALLQLKVGDDHRWLVDLDLPTVLVSHSYAPNIVLPWIEALIRAGDSQLLPSLAGSIWMSSSIQCPSLPVGDGGHPLMKLPVCLLECIKKALTDGFIKLGVHDDHKEIQHLTRQDSSANDMRAAKAYHRHMQWAKGDDVPGALTALRRLPALVVHGAEDQIIPVECGQHLANLLLLPPEKLQTNFVVIERASHQVMMEQPELVAVTVLHFLEGISDR
jgi:pimeloyl-ACP methyl ester carboxylesterase